MKIFLIVSLTAIGLLFLQNIFETTKVFAETSVNNKLYLIKGNLTLDNNITVDNTGVIFVDGDLYINSKQTGDTNKSGLVFIVKGTIYIDRSVGDTTELTPPQNTINAFMIAYGKKLDNSGDKPEGAFCSAWDSTANSCQDYTDSASQKFLIINGSVISLSPIAPSFKRQKTTLTRAAETINYQPKYLVILKDIFSRDLKIWQEVQ